MKASDFSINRRCTMSSNVNSFYREVETKWARLQCAGLTRYEKGEDNQPITYLSAQKTDATVKNLFDILAAPLLVVVTEPDKKDIFYYKDEDGRINSIQESSLPEDEFAAGHKSISSLYHNNPHVLQIKIN